LGSTLWPLAVRASRRLKLPGLIADIPMPGGRLGVGIASSLRLERKASIVDMNQELKRRLDLASALARSCIGRAESPRAETKVPTA